MGTCLWCWHSQSWQAPSGEDREARAQAFQGEPLEKETLRLKGGSNSAGTMLPPPPPSLLAAHPSNNTRTPAQSIYFHTCAFTTAGIPLALGYPSPAVLPGPWQWCLLLVGRGGRRARRARVGCVCVCACAGHGAWGCQGFARGSPFYSHPFADYARTLLFLVTSSLNCYCSCAIGEWGSARCP